MKPQIAAVVLAHDQPEYLAVTLQALANQSLQPNSILVVDSSLNQDCESLVHEHSNFGYQRINPDSTLPLALEHAIGSFENQPTWIWLLHDDSAPQKTALAELMATAEKSASVALVGPKQLRWQNPREILQLGLTLAPNGDIFSPVSGELDQAQHDHIDDVLAVSTAGALIRTEPYIALGGLDKKAPALAADIEYSVRARLAGHRVLVSPKAKLVHAALSLKGQRPKRWLGASPATAVRRAEIHLNLSLLSPLAAFAYWLFLPLIALSRSLLAIATKNPQRILAELSASIWGWFTIFGRISGRRKIKKIRKISFKKLAALRATWSQIKQSNFVRTDSELASELAQKLADSQIIADDQESAQSQPRGFVSSGGLWISLALLALNISWWPRDIAASGGGVLPLAGNWIELFNRAGASFQQIGLGYFAPSDPFVWVLAALGLTTFWAPSLAISALLFAFSALAFASAWRLIAVLTPSTLARNVSALSYALFPAGLLAHNESRLPVLITILLLPIYLQSTIEVAGLTTRSLQASTQQRVTWLALAGLSLAAISSSLPIAGIISLAALAILAIVRIKRIGYLLWVPLPAAALFGPTVLFYFVELNQPLGLLAQPGLPQPNSQLALIDLSGLAFSPVSSLTAGHITLAILVVSLLALIVRRAAKSALLAIATIVLLAGSTVADQIQISAVGVGSTTQNDQSVDLGSGGFMAFAAVLIAVLIANLLTGINRRSAKAVLASSIALLVVAPAALFAWNNPNSLTYSDGRAVPSIVSAEAKAGSALKLLLIRPSLNSNDELIFAAEIVNGDGVQFEDISLSYRFAVAKISESSPAYAQIAQLVADLASGSTGQTKTALHNLELGYVLVANSDLPQARELAFSLDSIAELESVGITEFGQLWRVREPNETAKTQDAISEPAWSVTKTVQLSILLGFGLMALPSRNGRRRAEDSEIFVDENEDANV
jgi:GT2 family glycosyltransferase